MLKICGITSRQDLQMVSKYQPDYIGIVCFDGSKRNVPAEKLSQILRKGTRNVKTIMVCVNPKIEFLEERAKYFDGFQLCGNETEKFCKEVKAKFPKHVLWKAFRIAQKDDLTSISSYFTPDAILVDAYAENAFGGTGKVLSDDILKNAKHAIGPHQDVWIAGGINAENVHHIQEISQCDGIDVSSSLEESVGVKSEKKVDYFFKIL